MTKRRFMAGCGGVVAVAIVAYLCWRPNWDLTYQNRSIENWFKQLPPTVVLNKGMAQTSAIVVNGQRYGSASNVKNPFEAWEHFGTNAVPFLMWKLRHRDSSIELWVRRLGLKLRLSSLPFRLASVERYQAVTGLIHVAPLPEETMRILKVLSTDSDAEIARTSRYILRYAEDPISLLGTAGEVYGR